MLDPHGFVATCNSTHFFVVRRGELWTSSGAYCLGGITRGVVLEVALEAGIPAYERDFSLTDVYGADEAFVTGTFAGVVPVREVDGRVIGDGTGPGGPVVVDHDVPGEPRVGVAVMLDDGSVTFLENTSGNWESKVLDSNHDGHVDVRTINDVTGAVRVFLGRGNGTFRAPKY